MNGAVKREATSALGYDTKKFKTVEKENLPYRDMAYDEQLQIKQGEVEKTFTLYNNSFVRQYPQYGQWYRNVFLETRFKIDPILKSPKTMAYRNKCELSVGYNPELGKLCAGPRIANSEDGKVQVGPCDKETLIHLPPSMIEIAQDFSNFLDKWNYLEEKCPWLNLFIRSTKGGEHMIIAIVLDGTQEVLKERKSELVKYYTEDYALKHSIKSVFIQPRAEDSSKKAFELDFLHAHGEEYLLEDVLDLKLVVTPGIYFRINTYAAEVLFQKTLDCADLKKRQTLVINLWCGCGELALLAAKRALHVIAIDPSKWNIKKAQFMARTNKIRNIDFIIAKPEDGLKQVWHTLPSAQEIVIIADPPTLCRMMTLGDMAAEMLNLKRFIYLYSSHKLHLVKNLLSLTEASLLPTRVVPVDVSPHNFRLELITSLKKVDPNEQPPPPPVPLVPEAATPEWIEEIERRAFAMGMAKALAAAPSAALPSVLDEEFGYRGVGREPYRDDYEFGRGPPRGGYDDIEPPVAGRFGASPATGGFGRGKFGSPALGRGSFRAPSASFGAGREKFGASPSSGYRGGRGGFGTPSSGFGGAGRGKFGASPGKFGAKSPGFGADHSSFGASPAKPAFGREHFSAADRFGAEEYSGFGKGYESGFGSEEYGGFGKGYGDYGPGSGSGYEPAAKRGRGDFSQEGFGRSGFSLDESDSWGAGYSTPRGRGGAGARGRGVGGARGRGGAGGRASWSRGGR